MSAWSFDMTAAPRGRQILVRTTKGETVLTSWLQPNRFTPSGRFDGFPENAKTLLAWCEVPAFSDIRSDMGLDLVTKHSEINVPIIEDVGGC